MSVEGDRGLSLEFKEGKPGFLMSVQRVEKTGEGMYRRPEFDYGEQRQFESLEEALNWMQEGGDSWHRIEAVFPGFEIGARLVGDQRSDGQLLIIETGEIQGVSPRSIDDHHGVSTDYENFFNIVIKLGSDYDLDPLFDRSIAHINIEGENDLRLSFTMKGGDFSGEELLEGFVRLQNRVEKVMNSLISGIITKEHVKTLINESLLVD